MRSKLRLQKARIEVLLELLASGNAHRSENARQAVRRRLRRRHDR